MTTLEKNMKERPILFSAPMVRALLDGSKTQTRRALRKQFKPDAVPAEMPSTDPIGGWVVDGHSGVWWCDAASNPDESVRCPYGQPGDRLWVRETWRTVTGADDIPPRNMMNVEQFTTYEADEPKPSGMGKLRPSMFMPHWASRITLEITRVRVERLKDISQADAIAEGAPPSHPSIDRVSREFGYADFSRSWYAQLWESINGPGTWEQNPWVWVIEFKKVDQ